MFVFAVDVHTLRGMTSSTRWITLAAGLLGLTGVALGAFGAHALKSSLAESGHTGTWQTAVLYHLVHSVALLALAGWRDAHAGPSTKAAVCWIIGIFLFSGSLYWLSLGGPRLLGPVTPLGGVALLAGWALVAASAWKRPAA